MDNRIVASSKLIHGSFVEAVLAISPFPMAAMMLEL
jgi:hypothetical protein